MTLSLFLRGIKTYRDFIIIAWRNASAEMISSNFALLTSVSINRGRLLVIRKRGSDDRRRNAPGRKLRTRRCEATVATAAVAYVDKNAGVISIGETEISSWREPAHSMKARVN